MASVDCPVAMDLNIHALFRVRCFLPTMLLFGARPVASQVPCPPGADSALSAGWRSYQAGSTERAIGSFRQAHRLCPHNLDASVGLGFASLRLGQLKEAEALFRDVLARDSANSDAWEGRARTSLRLGDTASALAAGRRVVELNPNNQDIRALLDRIAPDWERAAHRPTKRAPTLRAVARTRGQRFEIFTTSGWRAFYIKGVNFGVAMPGRYASEFPTDSATYARCLEMLAGMNANSLRVYTILPPSFYRALRGWNLSHPDRALWLVHGVWTELPPRHDFNARGWRSAFQLEMNRVVDVVHGAARIQPRRGHAAGQFDADVSEWVLAYIIGREWEPFAVKAFDRRNSPRSYVGRFLKVRHGPAMDVWLAQQCDLMLRHEVDTYNTLRPIAYTNWPTLDPLHHPTEATTAEEVSWRKRAGRRSEAQKLEYENDAIALDPNLVEPTPANPAGWFASYHAYPYYPDFMMLDPGYQTTRSVEGPSSYLGYLKELVAHHATMPTVISEYGVPSSRGTAHLDPGGRSHGGHDELAMAAIDARLTREIRGSGAAGSLLFAWLDEWFKKNWAVMDYEIPLDNTRLWHNAMDAEQHYGVLGLYAGDGVSTPKLGGDPLKWRALPLVQSGATGRQGAPSRIRAGADESYFYLAVELAGGRFPWDTLGIQLAIDSYQPAVGQHRLPKTHARSEVGFEFLIDLVSPDSGAIRVTPEYNRYDARVDSQTGDDFGRFSRRPVMPRNRDDGRFDSQFMITNRARFGRDGRFYRALRYDRGRLRYGKESSSTLADWFLDERAGLLQVRIPWDLINVTDPSTRTLLFDRRTEGAFGTATANDFHLAVVVYRKGPQAEILGALPSLVNGVLPASGFKPWRWQGWTEPRFHARLKPVYDSLRLLWREVPDGAPAQPWRTAPSN